MDKSRDIRVIDHIIDYCDRIDEHIDLSTETYDSFSKNKMQVDAVCMCVLQIGELSSVLSDEFKQDHDSIPWRQIKQVRNIIAHHYGSVDTETLWEIIKTDIPDLKHKCTLLSAAAESEEE